MDSYDELLEVDGGVVKNAESLYYIYKVFANITIILSEGGHHITHTFQQFVMAHYITFAWSTGNLANTVTVQSFLRSLALPIACSSAELIIQS